MPKVVVERYLVRDMRAEVEVVGIGSYFLFIPFQRAAPGRIGFREHAAGIECHDVNVEVLVADHVQDGLIFDAEACRKDDLAGDLLAQQCETLRW